MFVEPWPPPSSLSAPTVVDRQLALNRLRLGASSPFMLAHSPQLFERSLLAAAWARWQPELERTLTHRFRATDDALLRFLYFNGLLASGSPHEAVVNHDGLTPLVRVRPGTTWRPRWRRSAARTRCRSASTTRSTISRRTARNGTRSERFSTTACPPRRGSRSDRVAITRRARPEDERALRTIDHLTSSSLSSPAPAPPPERPFFRPGHEPQDVIVAELVDGGAIAGYVHLAVTFR